MSSIELFWTVYEIDFKNIATNSYLILCKACKNFQVLKKNLQDFWENHEKEVLYAMQLPLLLCWKKVVNWQTRCYIKWVFSENIKKVV